MIKLNHTCWGLCGILALCSGSAQTVLADTIYKCEQEDGTITYSQSPCRASKDQVVLKSTRSGHLYESEEETPQADEPGSADETAPDDPARTAPAQARNGDGEDDGASGGPPEPQR